MTEDHRPFGKHLDATKEVRENLAAADHIRYQWMLESMQKFRFFFVGLVFAILAFSIQFSVASPSVEIKYLELAAWISLFITGILALRDAGGFVLRYTQDKFDGLSDFARFLMWSLFLLSMLLFGTARMMSVSVTPVNPDATVVTPSQSAPE